jgi:ABC-type Na+ efflux pump permease subunit
MIERIGLVAWRELSATLLTRAFVMMVLTPIIALVAVPLILGPILLLASLTKDDGEAPVKVEPALEVVDGSGVLGDELAADLAEHWTVVVLADDPGDAGKSLPNGPAEARLVLGEAAVRDGQYVVYVKIGKLEHDKSDLVALQSVVDDRLGDARLTEAGLDPVAIRAALEVSGELEYVEVTASDALEIFAKVADVAVPAGVLFLMFGALSMAGQGLLTSTLEEKTTRVAEVLLGAVSPVELLTGKIVGQLLVSLIFALLWGGPAIVGLARFGSYFISPFTAIYLLIFIGIASLSWAAVMGGIGSAVNDLTEAQHLLAPLFMVMMVMFLPAVFAIASPESGIIVAASLLPPTAPAVMAARLTSSAPPPHWQVWISLLTSGAFGLFMLWAAGRLFRIGLLLRGSPPSFRTLIRWVVNS